MIIKDLENCGKYHTHYKEQPCEHCSFNGRAMCIAYLIDDAIGFINRQQAEIERLKEENALLSKIIDKRAESIIEHDNVIRDLHKEIKWLEKELNGVNVLTLQNAQSEARKEFAARLKCGVSITSGIITCEDIDNLLKKLEDERNAKRI